jgi:hypothetical protein
LLSRLFYAKDFYLSSKKAFFDSSQPANRGDR